MVLRCFLKHCEDRSLIHDEADRSNVRLINVYFGFVQLLRSFTDDRRNLKITAEIRFTPALLGFFVGVQSSRNPKECGCWPGLGRASFQPAQRARHAGILGLMANRIEQT
ncbi:MAG: hypothetical protein ACK52U_14515 [Synechococcaceae cyanobacterium]